MVVVSILCLLLMTDVSAWGASGYAAEVQRFATRYHENLPRLDTIRFDLERVIDGVPHIDDLIALAQVCFTWGDVRATTEDEKIESYERGRRAAKKAMELAPKNAAAHFWYATNTARWGQARGVVQSLFMLQTLQDEIRIILELDPKFVGVYSLSGHVYSEVPALLGGDLNKAEQMFRKGLEYDAKFTGLRVGLAKVLIKQGRAEEARGELRAVLDEKAPRNLADWVMKDSRQARELLQSIK